MHRIYKKKVMEKTSHFLKAEKKLKRTKMQKNMLFKKKELCLIVFFLFLFYFLGRFVLPVKTLAFDVDFLI